MSVVALGLACVLAVPAVAQDPASEDFARRQYESGLAFLRDRKFAEAIKDFQTVVDAYPASRVADAALLRIAEYQFDVAGDAGAAQAAVDVLLKRYATTESGPMALVLAGRIAMSRGRSPADVESALASYERVPRLFPGSDSVPASVYYAAEAFRLTHRDEEAISRYRQVSTDYPQSAWAPRALVGEARCLVLAGRAAQAMERLQRVRQRYVGTPESATALAWNTILYRLYLRPPAQPAFQFSGRSIAGIGGRLRDIQALAIDAATAAIYAANRTMVLVFDPGGRPMPPISAADARSIVFNRAGRPVVFCRGGVVLPGAGPVGLAVPKPDGSPRPLEDIQSGALTGADDLLVADRNLKAVARFAPAGKYAGTFAAANADRIAIDPTGRVAVLDQDGVALLEHDGKLRARIPARGQGYEFDRPVDLAADPLGHVYVLDRNRASVYVFAPQQPRLLTVFTLPPKAPGAFRKAVCFGLDAAGRLYLYDDDAEKIQVYQ